MENNLLNELWDNQGLDISKPEALDIISKAKKQRQGQYIGIAVMATTVLVLIAYIIYVGMKRWNDFNLGLTLMISSLLFRIIIEFMSLHVKEKKLISLDSKTYRNYLKLHYKRRFYIHFVVTPLCFLVYIFGMSKLFPYFKSYFSESVYTYFLISGILSILFISGIVIKGIIEELRYFKDLNNN
ncbi:MAG: hypothetical protein ED556_08830 [Winogradskyella sp.]|uniref:hypothetical protein n=1 Tax=Winogradskyella sp. TaxID=1883156 RepID=UPI000F3CABDA|nr:hypothetical protein [Winogradskyella sp.]RNC86387.1 MAG: hypothetical protein ED556_08830 [Winogradskyella sp.]